MSLYLLNPFNTQISLSGKIFEIWSLLTAMQGIQQMTFKNPVKQELNKQTIDLEWLTQAQTHTHQWI